MLRGLQDRKISRNISKRKEKGSKKEENEKKKREKKKEKKTIARKQMPERIGKVQRRAENP